MDLPCLAGEEETRSGNVTATSNTAQRDLGVEHVAGGVEDSLHHLGRERPAREHVAGDVAGAQLAGQGSRQVVKPGLAGGVGVVLQGRHAQAIDAADVNHGGRVGALALGGALELREQQLGQGEDALQVEGEDLGPGGVGVLLNVGTPGGAGVVDEDVQTGGLPGGQVGGQALALLEVLQVGGQSVRRGAVAGDAREFLNGTVAGLGVAAGDVDLCAVGDEALGDHAADALGTYRRDMC